MDNLHIAIDANLEDLVDAPNRCVDPTDKAADNIVIAFAEDGDCIEEWMFNDSPLSDWEQMKADMCKAFAGQMSHDDFFLKYDSYYQHAKREIIDHLDTRIWNRYTDLHDVPVLDMYEYNGVSREMF